MPRSNSTLTKASWRASKTAYQHADKALSQFARWITTDHTGFSRALDCMPKMGVIASLKYILVHLIISTIGVLVSGLLTFILIAFGIPLLIQFLLM